MGFDWKSTVGAVAPTIATALGGPVAGVAVKALASALLGDESATEDAVAQAVAAATPADLMAMKEADHRFKLDMQKAGIELEKIAANDRADARNLAGKMGGVAHVSIGLTVLIGWVAANAAILSGVVTFGDGGIPDMVVGRVLGTIDSAVLLVLSFFFGSMHKEK
jgi:hypothetical protein